MDEPESAECTPEPQQGLRALIRSKAFLSSRKGQLLLAESDFIRCGTAAIVYFAISIAVVSKDFNTASKAAAVFGFVATIAHALDAYLVFNDLAPFLRGEDSSAAPETHKEEGDDDSESDSDSD